LINPFTRDKQGNFVVDQPERVRLMRRICSSDIFLIGTNAITLDGKLVNTDGFGNRVSAMVFGPEKVIIVVGANKIVKDLDEAMHRIRTVCAPTNAVRHAIKHQVEGFKSLPCVKIGICANCNDPFRICHYATIIEGEQQRRQGHINVVIVGENLGI
jgi:acyl-CoA hydrolase